MNVLVSCGKKSNRIEEALKNRFDFSIGVCVCEYISDLDDFMNKGGDFDRVLVMEQSITRDEQAADFDSVVASLDKLADIVTNMQNTKAVEIVCVLNTEETAELASSELFLLKNSTALLLHEDTKYSMKFLSECVQTPINKFADNPVLSKDIYKEKSLQSINNYYSIDNNEADNSSETEEDTFGADTDLGELMNQSDEAIDEGSLNHNSEESFGEDVDELGDNFGELSSDFGDISDEGFGESDGFDSESDGFGESDENFGDGSNDFGETDENFGDTSNDLDDTSNDFGEADGDFGEADGFNEGSTDEFDSEPSGFDSEPSDESDMNFDGFDTDGNESDTDFGDFDGFEGESGGFDLDNSDESSDGFGSLDDNLGDSPESIDYSSNFDGFNETDSASDDAFKGFEDSDVGSENTESLSEEPDFNTETDNNDLGFDIDANENSDNDFGDLDSSFDTDFNTQSDNAENEDFGFGDELESGNNSPDSLDNSDDADFDTSIFEGDSFGGFGAENSENVDDNFGFDSDIGESTEESHEDSSIESEADKIRNSLGNASDSSDGIQFNSIKDAGVSEDEPPKVNNIPSNDVKAPVNPVQKPKKKGFSLFGHRDKNKEAPKTPIMAPKPPIMAPKNNNKAPVARPQVPQNNRAKVNEFNPAAELAALNQEIINAFKYSSGRGKSILVSGTRNSGTSTMVANFANLISKLGLSALVVDLDFNGRTQAYMNVDAFTQIHEEDPNLEAIKICLNNRNINFLNYAIVVKEGYNLLTTGLAADITNAKEVIRDTEKVIDFIHSAAGAYDCVLYDCNFEDIPDNLDPFVVQADQIVLNIEPNSKGFLDFMNIMCNVEANTVRDKIFNKSKLVFSKSTDQRYVLGKRIDTYLEAMSTLDNIVSDLTGYTVGFSGMNMIGEIPYNEVFDTFMFSNQFITDRQDMELVFKRLLKAILVD